MQVRDPVCGREMEPGDATAVEDHEGWAYFFCSPVCRSVFRTAPQRFRQGPAKDWPRDSARGD